MECIRLLKQRDLKDYDGQKNKKEVLKKAPLSN